MKKIPMILLLVAPYVLVISMLYPSESNIYWQVGLVLYLLVLLFNLVYAFLLPRFGYEAKELLFWNMLLKLCNVPIYLFVLFVVLITNVMIIPAIPFLIVIEYLLLLSTSVYGIKGIMISYKNKKIALRTLVVNIIAQLMFCTDVFSSLYCYVKICKSKV